MLPLRVTSLAQPEEGGGGGGVAFILEPCLGEDAGLKCCVYGGGGRGGQA